MTNPLIEELEVAATCGSLSPHVQDLLSRAATALRAFEPIRGDIPYREILGTFNEVLGDCMPKATKLPPSRRTAIAARWTEEAARQDLVWWKNYFTEIKASDFLCGRGKSEWRPNFDWFVKPLNMTKVLEGNYRNRGPSLGDHNRRMLGFGA